MNDGLHTGRSSQAVAADLARICRWRDGIFLF